MSRNSHRTTQIMLDMYREALLRAQSNEPDAVILRFSNNESAFMTRAEVEEAVRALEVYVQADNERLL